MGINLKFIEKRPWVAWVLFTCTVILVFLMGLLAASIIERRMEAVFVDVPKTEIMPFEPRNEIWGQNYPLEFQSYYGTADTSFRSKYNGSATIDMLEQTREW